MKMNDVGIIVFMRSEKKNIPFVGPYFIYNLIHYFGSEFDRPFSGLAFLLMF